MAWFSRHKKHKHKELALVVDIGSASIAAGLVVLNPDKKPRVIYSVRREMVFQKKLDFDRFLRSMFETLDVVLKMLEQKSVRYLNTEKYTIDAITTVLCTYASPWYAAHTKILKIKKKEPFEVTKSLIDRVIEEEKQKLAQQSSANQTEGDTDMIEQAITSIKLNGYTVESVEDKEATELDLTLSASFLPKHIAERVENIVQRTFHVEKIIHHSFPLAAFTALRDIFHAQTQFLFLDVSGEVSDLSVIKDDALLETLSFPKGKHFMIRTLMGSLQLEDAEVRSLIKMHVDAMTHKDTSNTMNTALGDVQTAWSDSFTELFKKIQSHLVLPTKIFFIADSEIAPLIKAFIQQSKVGDVLDPRPVDFAMLRHHVDVAGAQKRDSFIALITLFFNKL